MDWRCWLLAAPGLFRVYRIQRPVATLAIVAGSFHIKPLLRVIQSADRYQVLGLSLGEACLFEGNRDSLDLVDFPEDIVKTFAEAHEIGENRPRMEVWQLGGGASAEGVHQRHAAGGDPTKLAAERFFRTVDRVILERYSRRSGLPLIVAALPEHHTPFREISRNPLLLDSGINNYPNALNPDELRHRAWQVLEPHYLKRLEALVEMYGVARARDLGTDNLARALKAAAAGRIATLLIEADRQIPGRINADHGEIIFDDLSHPDVDDLLDDLAERVLDTGGQTVIVPADRMPTESGLAAIFRF